VEKRRLRSGNWKRYLESGRRAGRFGLGFGLVNWIWCDLYISVAIVRPMMRLWRFWFIRLFSVYNQVSTLI
jgi:hypothetical protein